jgi:phospholipid/cholesterol/gamma-HCH transport system permease protein
MHGDAVFSLHPVMFDSLAFIDIIPATIKTFFFGFIGMIGCYKGSMLKGTASVGQAANSAVVTTRNHFYH